MRVLKFGAVWCPGCLIMKPRWEEIEKENPWLLAQYYDFDQDKEVVKKYNITKELPIFVFLDKNDKEFLRLEGEIEKDKLVGIINENREK
ncbi:MAG: thioredoxin family protein [Patescibacteria group bacterium]|nr:thioredoxin family protein [Patescibacteria group bacterium]MDD5294335.1 thioredoxin family protein [Patescibacteria group bacterium]MDD5554048.1 thioredoxin family protein [Patescibacteria group bacterium]